MDLLVGQTLDGDFELVEAIGAGGHADVYVAKQRSVGGRRVAVKVLSVLYSSLPEADVRRATQAMMREAELLGTLRSTCYVAVYRTGITPDLRPYIAMELAEGATIAKLLQRDKRVAPRVVAEVIRQWSHGLGELHGRGFVHRDVSPANCVVAQVGGDGGAQGIEIRTYDLGTASQVAAMADRHRVGWEKERPAGTPAYMAPEQAAGGIVDGRADQFALAAITYELLTGVRAMPAQLQRAADMLEWLRGTQTIPQQSLAVLRPDLPEPLVRAVHRGLQRDPSQRFADVRRFGDVVADWLLHEVDSDSSDAAQGWLTWPQRMLGRWRGGQQ